MTQSVFVGIDLGGTNVRVGLISVDGETLISRDEKIHAHMGAEHGIARIIGIITDLVARVQIQPRAIGIGATGPVDHIQGIIHNPYTLPTWEDVDIIRPICERIGVPAFLENDADVAALGETWLGAGRGFSKVAVVTVGTGIGTAFIENGKIFRGFEQIHPEGGHIPIDPNGPECYCGAHGCWEALASGNAIVEAARREISLFPESKLIALERTDQLTAQTIIEAANNGDVFAMQVLQTSARYLGLGLVSLINFYMPECIIFTGGVMRSFATFKPTLTEVIKQHSVMNPIDRIPLVLAELGQNAGMVGAARAAMLEYPESTEKE